MSDGGAVERNVQFNQTALERAAQRNGGQNMPAPQPTSVTAERGPVQAVASTRRVTGANDEDVGGPDLTEAPEPEPVNDAVLSLGRGGQVESSTGWHDTPTIPIGAGISSSGEHVATLPSDFGRPVRPDSPHGADGNWNMSDIANYKVGG